MTSNDTLLDRVRKLLAKAEAQGVTAAEAEALTAKAAELMARHGIDRALLAASRPETDQPTSRTIEVPNPWSGVRAHLLCGISAAMRCQCIQLHTPSSGRLLHLFGYASDLERADILYTSLLVQMAHGLVGAQVPPAIRSPRAWRRSWLLGYSTAVIARVRTAEHDAVARASDEDSGIGKGTELVLADRAEVIRRQCEQAYPTTRAVRMTYTGNGYRTGYTEGQRADIGGTRLPGASRPTLGSGR